jgi:truncated hemoglobin YjbI
MPRPPQQPPRSAFTDPADIAAYDRALRRYTGDPVPEHYNLGEYFGALAVSPLLVAIAGDLGAFVRTAGDRSNTYKHWEREFVDQILSKDWKTNVVQKTHVPDALSTGMRMEAIEAIRYGHEEDLTDDEKQLATFIRQAVSGTVTDESWDGMEKRMGTRGVVEYTGFILWLQWIMRMMQALKVNDPSEEEIDKLIADLKADKSKVPDYRVRIR